MLTRAYAKLGKFSLTSGPDWRLQSKQQDKTRVFRFHDLFSVLLWFKEKTYSTVAWKECVMCWRVPATALKSYTSNTGCLAAGNKRAKLFRLHRLPALQDSVSLGRGNGGSGRRRKKSNIFREETCGISRHSTLFDLDIHFAVIYNRYLVARIRMRTAYLKRAFVSSLSKIKLSWYVPRKYLYSSMFTSKYWSLAISTRQMLVWWPRFKLDSLWLWKQWLSPFNVLFPQYRKVRQWVVCSTPHALSPDALSPHTLSHRAISLRALSPNGLRNRLKNEA